MKEKLSSPYFPGIVLFVISLIVGFIVYKDYGIAWDEPLQRGPALLSYDYIFHGSKELFLKPNDNHGAGFELPLIFIEKWFKLTDTRDMYLMRHLVTHLLFLISAFCGYVLALRLFKNPILASLGFLMIVLAPRIYAHSFFNSKDLPFLSVIIIVLMLAQMAFEKNKVWLYLVLGLACGYATSIRIMGVMLFCFFMLFLAIDAVMAMKEKEKPTKQLIGMGVFFLGFTFLMYIAWPYLWPRPWTHFVESFTKLSHYEWKGSILMGGKTLISTELPWTYFPSWFLISNPILWLIAGFAGFIWIISDAIKAPMTFLRNTNERNFLLLSLCFAGPIFSVLALHSVIYDDWRHLYFVYPPFALMGLYSINKLMQGKLTRIVQGVCALQVAMIAFFMIKNHPHQNVYMNELVSHDEEYIRKNYEMDYWGTSNKQSLEYILDVNPAPRIFITAIFPEPLGNNIMILPAEERKRLQIVHPDSAEYLITNFRFHPEDFDMNEEHSFTVQNSSVSRIYKLRGTQLQFK